MSLSVGKETKLKQIAEHRNVMRDVKLLRSLVLRRAKGVH
jgi:hypothetical protein